MGIVSSVRSSTRRAWSPSPKSSRRHNLGLLWHPRVTLVGKVGSLYMKTCQGDFPRKRRIMGQKQPREVVHRVKIWVVLEICMQKNEHTKEVLASQHEERTQVWGASVTKDAKGCVGPRPSFEGTLVRFGPLLDFDTLVEEGALRRSWDSESHLFCGICGPSKGLFRVFVMGYGMLAHGVYPWLGLIVRDCKSINK